MNIEVKIKLCSLLLTLADRAIKEGDRKNWAEAEILAHQILRTCL